MIAGAQIPAGHGASTVLPDFDFETYSEAGYTFHEDLGYFKPTVKGSPGLEAVGAAVYSEHPSTFVRWLCYDLKDGRGTRHWVPGMLPPFELFDYFRKGGIIEAWNSGFEYLIWQNVCHKRMGWPALPQAQLRCAMAKGKAFGLPGKLEKAAEVTRAQVQKDKRGKQLIRLLCIPQKPTKKQPLLRNDDPTLLGELGAYCEKDIKAEAAVSHLTPDLSPDELELWQLDQEINQRGIHIDKEALDNCISIVNQAFERYNSELVGFTAGSGITSATELDQIKAWLATQGLETPSLDKDHVETLLKRNDLPPHVYRVIEIRSLLGAASVKKLFAIDRMLPADQRLKDLFAFCGADRTGRWAGRGPQPQNLPNSGPPVVQCTCGWIYWSGREECTRIGCGTLKESAKEIDWCLEAVEIALADIATGNLDWVESQWGDAVAAVAGCLRGLFSAAPGHDLLCSDFSAIEAVVLAFMSGEQWRMDVFNTHGKIYEASASTMSGVPLEEILQHKKDTGAHHPLRKKGKVNELACGYGGGVGAAKAFGADKLGLSDEEIQSNVKAWRAASPSIAGYGNWGISQGLLPTPPKYGKPDQPLGFWYGLQGAAYKAIRNPSQCFSFRGIAYGMKDGNLYARLPSGRSLVYHEAKLELGTTPWGSQTTRMTYMGWNTNYLKGPTGWIKMDTYGPKLAENACQAIARDILAFSMKNLDNAGYDIVMHVHDEIIAEVPKDFGSIEEFERIMAIMPPWAHNWPIRAAGGWRGLRYRKD